MISTALSLVVLCVGRLLARVVTLDALQLASACVDLTVFTSRAGVGVTLWRLATLLAGDGV